MIRQALQLSVTICRGNIFAKSSGYLGVSKGLLRTVDFVVNQRNTKSSAVQSYDVIDPDKVAIAENQLTCDVISKVNDQIKNQHHGRLFAVVFLAGKQFKVTPEDLIIVQGYWPPTIGSRITLNKVMLVGSSDFTLVGRPLLSPDLVHVEATVIEKTLSHTKTHFRKKRRKQYMRINFYRTPFTMLRINSIVLKKQINEENEVQEISNIVL